MLRLQERAVIWSVGHVLIEARWDDGWGYRQCGATIVVSNHGRGNHEEFRPGQWFTRQRMDARYASDREHVPDL